MSKIKGRFIDKDPQSLSGSNQIQLFIDPNGFLAKTVNGVKVNVDDASATANNLWTALKTSNELSNKASITYVDNAIAGLKWKQPVIDFKTQAQLDAIGSPNAGDRYIITDGANINSIAEYNSGWGYTAAQDNWTLIRKSNDKAYSYDADSGSAFKWADIGGISQSETFIIEAFALTETDISTNKKVTLTYTPTSSSYVAVDVVGGCRQHNTVDYAVNVGTKEVSWNGLGLDGLLIATDVILVTYATLS